MVTASSLALYDLSWPLGYLEEKPAGRSGTEKHYSCVLSGSALPLRSFGTEKLIDNGDGTVDVDEPGDSRVYLRQIRSGCENLWVIANIVSG